MVNALRSGVRVPADDPSSIVSAAFDSKSIACRVETIASYDDDSKDIEVDVHLSVEA